MRIAKPPATAALPIDSPATDDPSRLIAIVAERSSLEPPENIDDFSSHRLLWEFVRDELIDNPFAVGDDADAYLTARMRKLGVAEQTLVRTKFIDALIAPAYREGLVRQLRRADVPIREFDSRPGELSQQLASAAALLHVWPNQRRVHAIDFAGRPALRPGLGAREMLRRCRAALTNAQPSPHPSENLICARVIRELISAR
jgi:hypothetical protein